MTDDRRITACQFKTDPALRAVMVRITGRADAGQREVVGTLNDGSELRLFSYYPDELTFWEEEFIGLTVSEALKLFHDRDIAYLRS